MNQIQILKQKLETHLPGVTTVVDEPLKPDGPWMLDVAFKDQVVNVEWRPHRGFGVSARESLGYGEGPDEILPGIGETADRVVELLKTSRKTAKPLKVTLAELRKRQRLSQAELAQRLKVAQAAISNLEENFARSQLSTLRKAVEALGAQFEVRAVLPDDQVFTLELPKSRRMGRGRRVLRRLRRRLRATLSAARTKSTGAKG